MVPSPLSARHGVGVGVGVFALQLPLPAQAESATTEHSPQDPSTGAAQLDPHWQQSFGPGVFEIALPRTARTTPRFALFWKLTVPLENWMW
jgi:hypothetical protein